MYAYKKIRWKKCLIFFIPNGLIMVKLQRVLMKLQRQLQFLATKFQFGKTYNHGWPIEETPWNPLNITQHYGSRVLKGSNQQRLYYAGAALYYYSSIRVLSIKEMSSCFIYTDKWFLNLVKNNLNQYSSSDLKSSTKNEWANCITYFPNFIQQFVNFVL